MHLARTSREAWCGTPIVAPPQPPWVWIPVRNACNKCRSRYMRALRDDPASD